jgi:hypothetical protein
VDTDRATYPEFQDVAIEVDARIGFLPPQHNASVTQQGDMTMTTAQTELASGGLFIAVTGVVNLVERRPPAVGPDQRDSP